MIPPALPRRTAIAGCAVFLFLSCTGNPGGGTAFSSLAKDFMVPRAGRDVYLDGRNPGTKEESELKLTVQLKVELDPDQVVQDIREENLDADPSLEQLLIYKQKDDQEDLLRVMVIDLDEERGLWSGTWRGATRATNIKTLSVRILTLNNSPLPEIVCQGTNNKGEQTLDIFHVSGNGTFPLGYAPVLSISADINIEVQLPLAARSDSGAEGELAPAKPSAPAGPNAIIAQSKDLESTSPLDMVETRYQWKSGSGAQAPGQYLISSTVKVPGASVQEAALDQLFNSAVADMERKYLHGAWIHRFVNQRKKNITQIIFFDSNARTIRMIEGDRMEAHEWVSSHKPAYGSSIKVYTINESFHSQRTEGTVRVIGLNDMEFVLQAEDSTMQDRNDWNGQFTRMGADSENDYFAAGHQAVAIGSLVLSGLYRNESGQELVFEGSRFTWREGGKTRQGGFATYGLNAPVLEMEYLDDKGLVTERSVFIAKASEQDQGRQSQRILELQPATVDVSGVRPLAEDPIRLEQAPQDISH